MSASAKRHSEALGEFKTPLSDRGMETRILERANHSYSEDSALETLSRSSGWGFSFALE
jgi:hypothetical protein